MSYWEKLGASDEWYTPPEVFQALGCSFDLDPANAAIGGAHVPCRESWGSDGLEREWSVFVWLNPPFGGRNGLKPWLEKFFAHGNGIVLTPDRTSASPWFWPAWQKADLVLFTKKIKFVRPDGSRGKSPSNGTALMASGEAGCLALRKAAAEGFGILAEPQP